MAVDVLNSVTILVSGIPSKFSCLGKSVSVIISRMKEN